MLIFAACLAIFVYGMVASMLGTINPGLAEKFQLQNEQTGYVALAQGIGLIIASVSVGPLIDKRGKKIGLLLGLALVAVSFFALANASGYGMILLAMLVLGFGGGVVLTGANALGSDVSETKRAMVLNFLNVFVGLGGLLTPFVAGNLLAGDAIRVAYGAAAITAVTFVVHLFLKIPPPPISTGQEGASSEVFRRPILYVLALITMLYTACEFGIWNWLVKYLMSQGLAQSTALNILSLGFALGLLLGRVAVAPILIKIRPLTVVMGSAMLMALSTFAILHVSDPTMAALTVFCAGVAMAPVFPTTVSIVGDLFRSGTATAIGFTITCGFTGLALSSPLIGGIAGTDPEGLQTALMVLPICSLVIVGLTIGLRAKLSADPHTKNEEAPAT